MLKKLTAEGRFEAGIDNYIKGRVCAFTAVMTPSGDIAEGCPETHFMLGIATANEPGYVAVPLHWCHGSDYSEMSRHADELNLELFGWEPRQSARIVSSSMRSMRDGNRG